MGRKLKQELVSKEKQTKKDVESQNQRQTSPERETQAQKWKQRKTDIETQGRETDGQTGPGEGALPINTGKPG